MRLKVLNINKFINSGFENSKTPRNPNNKSDILKFDFPLPESDFFKLLEPQYYKTAHYDLLYKRHEINDPEVKLSSDSRMDFIDAPANRFSRPRDFLSPTGTARVYADSSVYAKNPASQSTSFYFLLFYNFNWILLIKP